MPLPSDRLPTDPRSFSRALAKIQRDLNELRAARTLEAATIGSGGLTITGGGSLNVSRPAGGGPIFYAGAFGTLPHPDGSPQQGTYISREDGTVAFEVFSQAGDPTNQAWNLYDVAGNLLAAEDQQAKQGLARPYIDASGWFGVTEVPAFTTTSATFASLMSLPWIKQHPKVQAFYLVQASTGATSGEIRLVDDAGTQIGSTVVVGLGGYTFGSLTGALAGGHMSQTYLHWQGRVTAGAGTIGVKGLSTFGVQS